MSSEKFQGHKSRGPMGHGPMGGGEKAKDFKGSVKRLVKHMEDKI